MFLNLLYSALFAISANAPDPDPMLDDHCEEHPIHAHCDDDDDNKYRLPF